MRRDAWGENQPAGNVDSGEKTGLYQKKGVFRPRTAYRPELVEQRQKFIQEQGNLDPDKLVFIDEAGVSLAMSYNYGWARPGVTPIIERPLRGKNVTLIGAIANDGPRALRRVEGSVNGEEFLRFLKETLGPTLNQGDIVVMDGPRVHRVRGVKEALAEFGATALYLPAYSPELNPIEMTWSWIKARIRKAAPRKIGPLRDTIAAAWDALTQELCSSWIGHSNYRTFEST